MKKMFSEYYNLSEVEFKDLWNNCTFVFDTSILLNQYKYSEKTRNTLFTILEKIKERLWLPYQIGYEYHNNRPSVIFSMEGIFDKAIKNIEEELNDIKLELKNLKYPSWEDKENSRIIKIINESQKKITEVIEQDKKNYPELKENDFIREKLSELYNHKIGEPYNNENLKKIFNEGKIRYDDKIPPGYKDIKDKEGNEKYGDLVIWKQMIDKSKDTKTPIIFITDDRKEDWWWIVNNKTIGCRPELIKEFYSETKQNFYMYNFDRFMKYAEDNLNIQINKDVINEVKEVRENTQIIEEEKENPANLTKRELEVLSYLVQGYSNKQIADEISTSVPTAKAHVVSILQKLNVEDRV